MKLYTCTNIWSSDADSSNGGSLDFYTSAKAAKLDLECAKECGIVEVEATFVKQKSKPKKVKYISSKKFEAKERAYVALARRLLTVARKETTDQDVVYSAVQFALGTLKKARREQRSR